MLFGHFFADPEDRGTFARMVRNSEPLPDDINERLLLALICAAAGFGAYETIAVVTPGVFHALWHLFGRIMNVFLDIAGSISLSLNHDLYHFSHFVVRILGVPFLAWITWKRPRPIFLIDCVGLIYAAIHWGPAFFS